MSNAADITPVCCRFPLWVERIEDRPAWPRPSSQPPRQRGDNLAELTLANRKIIGLIGAGAMGSSIGRLLAENGLHVLSPLDGRSDASVSRATEAGMQNASYNELLQADLVLSVVPPAQARQVAEQFASVCADDQAPIFIDANALSPDTKCSLEHIICSAGGRFVDGVIIGGPPREGYDGPRLYVSGEHTPAALVLREAGLDVRKLDGPVGAAAALKMCYGGFNKGITALTTAVLLAARRSGADKALIEEFAISQKSLLARSKTSVPRMYPKAYRWIAEFEEVSSFVADDPASADIFAAIAHFYADRAKAFEDSLELQDLLTMLDSATEQLG